MSARNTAQHTTGRGGRRLAAAGVAALLAGAGVLGGATVAFAAGSDSPTPYAVTAEGVTLPSGMTFVDNGHVNVRANQGDRGIHFESLNNQPSGAWIGASFLPWSAFGYDADTLCVEWVQIAEFNEHFGEGGQDPVGNGCAPDEEFPVIVDPGTTEPGTEKPGTTEPGTEKPGTTDPGTTDPGTTDPGTTDPGTTDPGTTDPGTTDPGTTDPGTEVPTDAEAPIEPAAPEIPALPLTDDAQPATLALTGQDAFPVVLTGVAALAVILGGAGVLVAARRRS